MDVVFFFFFQAEDGIRDGRVTGVQTCALPISAVRRPRRAEHQPVAVGEREAELRRRGEETGRQRPGDPGGQGEREARGQARAQREQPAAPAAHRDFTVTLNTPPSLRPWTAGLYISSACAGGRTKTPGVVARATYVALYVPGQSTVAAYTTRSSRISLWSNGDHQPSSQLP